MSNQREIHRPTGRGPPHNWDIAGLCSLCLLSPGRPLRPRSQPSMLRRTLHPQSPWYAESALPATLLRSGDQVQPGAWFIPTLPYRTSDLGHSPQCPPQPSLATCSTCVLPWGHHGSCLRWADCLQARRMDPVWVPTGLPGSTVWRTTFSHHYGFYFIDHIRSSGLSVLTMVVTHFPINLFVSPDLKHLIQYTLVV